MSEVENIPSELPVNKCRVYFSQQPSPATLWRWINKGIRDPKGGKTRVKLIPHRVGGRVYVTREAARQFDAALNPASTERKAVESVSARAKAEKAALDKILSRASSRP